MVDMPKTFGDFTEREILLTAEAKGQFDILKMANHRLVIENKKLKSDLAVVSSLLDKAKEILVALRPLGSDHGLLAKFLDTLDEQHSAMDKMWQFSAQEHNRKDILIEDLKRQIEAQREQLENSRIEHTNE